MPCRARPATSYRRQWRAPWPAFALAHASAARLTTSGPVRVDGGTLALEPADLALTLDNVKTPAGVSLQGRTTVALAATPAQPQTVALVLGPEQTATVGLTTS